MATFNFSITPIKCNFLFSISFINRHALLRLMPAPRLRSRSLRKVYSKVSGGRTTIHHVRKKPKAARCGNCGSVLKGVPRLMPFAIKNTPKTMKRPERPYGGVLCTTCMRQKILDKIRP